MGSHLRKVKKQTDKIVNELLSLRESRKSIDDFNMSFLTNFSDVSRLMHFFISKDRNNLFNTAFRQYFVFLVSCWETYFRDLFVYINTKDSESIVKFVEKLKINEDQLDLSIISMPELLSKSFNFQNLNDLELAYNSLWGSNFLDSVCNTKADICGLNGKFITGLSVSSMFDSWHSTIIKVFDIRHKVVHDANYRPELDASFIQRTEALFLLIPQLATYFVAERFSFERMMFSDGKSYAPYIFNVDELTKDCWKVVDGESLAE